MRRGFLFLSAALAFGTAALLPVGAAASGVTAQIGQANLQSRVLVVVTVNATCPAPFWDPSTQTIAYEVVNASVEEASGKEISHGFGGASGQFFSCDNSTVAIPVSVLADTNGPPFHGGSAIVTASVSVVAGTSCGPNCFYNLVSQSATDGPRPVHI